MKSRGLTVSVTVPVFNEEKYLPHLLDSLLTQSRPADEIIICNNNSTDGSVRVARSYQTRLPIKIINQPIKGILPTADAAWRAAHGDIIIRTDADSIAPKDWIKNIVHHFDEDDHLAALGGLWDSSDGSPAMKVFIHYGLLFGELVNLLHYGYRQLWGCNLSVRRWAMEKINGYYSDDLSVIEDRLLAAKLKQNGLYFTNYYDCNNLSSTRRYNGSFKGLIRNILSSYFPKFYDVKAD